MQRMADALCVFCRKHPVDPKWRPFCSERCKMQDLAKWADGAYRVAADPVPDDESGGQGLPE
jgi:uncharacterized protein